MNAERRFEQEARALLKEATYDDIWVLCVVCHFLLCLKRGRWEDRWRRE